MTQPDELRANRRIATTTAKATVACVAVALWVISIWLIFHMQATASTNKPRYDILLILKFIAFVSLAVGVAGMVIYKEVKSVVYLVASLLAFLLAGFLFICT